jgi:hypothetical protein
MKGIYQGKFTAAIRKKAKAMPGVLEVFHILPRCYCVAKPATHCAVFAVPAVDNEPGVNCNSVSIQHESTKYVELGDWCSLAYIRLKTDCGMRVVVEIHEN